MGGSNGTNGRARKSAKKPKKPDRDEKGLFQPGNSVGALGGRPKGSPDLLTLARAHAEKHGVDHDEAVGELLEMMRLKAIEEKDIHAADSYLKHVFKQAKAAAMDLNIDARTVSIGPEPPRGQKLGAWIERFREVAEAQGMLEDDDGSD